MHSLILCLFAFTGLLLDQWTLCLFSLMQQQLPVTNKGKLSCNAINMMDAAWVEMLILYIMLLNS